MVKFCLRKEKSNDLKSHLLIIYLILCYVFGPKEESEKVGLKLNIQKTKIMASGSITSWQIDGETMERVRVFLGAPKSLLMVTAAMKLKDTYSLEEKLQPT